MNVTTIRTAQADPLPLARVLIACASVTPADDGAQAVLADALRRLGFTVTSLPFGDPAAPTPNLFARIGSEAPHVCFAGHTDVVPAGDEGWRSPPFAALVEDGVLYGRGACDMKGAIAAFIAAAARHLDGDVRPGSISLLITGDEEGTATDGTVRVLEWMAANGQVPDLCVVGEPTSVATLGDTIKLGRRGTLSARIAVTGVQGHVAYPQHADNPVHRLLRLLAELTSTPLDGGTPEFEPSNLQVTSIDVGNPATNVIPSRAEARLNIRFNDLHDGAALGRMLREACDRHAPGAALDIHVGGEAFRTRRGPLTDALAAAITRCTGHVPTFETGGGTSDARFIARYCPVADFGLVGASMHKVDERVPLRDLELLTAIYADLLDRLLPAPPGAGL